MERRLKGDPTDYLLLLVMLFFLAVSFVVVMYANGIIQNIIQTTALNQSSAYESINSSFSTINEYTTQRAFTMMFGLLIISILATSFLIRVHPVFLFIYIFLLGITIFVSVYLANTYEMIVSTPQFAEFATNYATMTWVMEHIAVILVGVGALSMIIIFGKIGLGGVDSTGSDI